MGTLEYFKHIHNYTVNLKRVPVIKKGNDSVPALLVNDAKTITLAEFSADTKNLVTAHRLKDFRKKSNSLILLPHVDIVFDRLLEGSVYFNELLSTKSKN